MNQDFRDLLRELSEADAEFLVVGAYALAVHGTPRATGDIDIWINPTPDNASQVYSALEQFGAPLDDLRVEDLHSPDVVFQMGLPPRRIDILTDISGVDFDDAWPNKVEEEVEGLTVPFLGAEEMLQNKRATGRPRDAIDADELEELLEDESRE